MESSVHKIQAFVEAARLGSLTRAAEELGCTQSTVSRMISNLETDWDVRLFTRSGPGVVPTPEGERLLADARAVCEAYGRLQRRASALRDLGSGAVRVAAPSSVVARRLPGPLGRFVAEHPGIEVSVVESTYADAERLLRSGEADVAFVAARIADEEFESTPFDRDEIVVVAPRGHFPDEPREVALASLLGERLVADSETAPLLQRELSCPSIRCVTSDITAILALVEAGLGVSLLPSLALGRQGFDVDVRHLEKPAWRTLYLAHRRRGELSAAALEFLAYLAG